MSTLGCDDSFYVMLICRNEASTCVPKRRCWRGIVSFSLVQFVCNMFQKYNGKLETTSGKCID